MSRKTAKHSPKKRAKQRATLTTLSLSDNTPARVSNVSDAVADAIKLGYLAPNAGRTDGVVSEKGWRAVAKMLIEAQLPGFNQLEGAVKLLQKEKNGREDLALALLIRNESLGSMGAKWVVFSEVGAALARLDSRRREVAESALLVLQAIIAQEEGLSGEYVDRLKAHYDNGLEKAIQAVLSPSEGEQNLDLTGRILATTLDQLDQAARGTLVLSETGFEEEGSPMSAQTHMGTVTVGARDDLRSPLVDDFLAIAESGDQTDPRKLNQAIDVLVDADFESDYAIVHAVWSRTIIAFLNQFSNGEIFAARLKEDHRVDRTYDPPLTTTILYPDGHVLDVKMCAWYGLSRLNEQDQYGVAIRILPIDAEKSARPPITAIFDPLVTVLTASGVRMWDPGRCPDGLTHFQKVWLNSRTDWPPTNRAVAEQLVKHGQEGGSAEMQRTIRTLIEAQNLPEPQSPEEERAILIEWLASYMDDERNERDERQAPNSGVRVVQASSKFDDQHTAEYHDRWMKRIKDWGESAPTVGGENGSRQYLVELLQPELRSGKAEGGQFLQFDPPHTIRVAYPSGKIIETECSQWSGLVRTRTPDRDLLLICISLWPYKQFTTFEPRAFVTDVTTGEVLYDPRTVFHKLSGAWKAWLRAHPEWPHGQEKGQAPVLYGTVYSAALEQMHDTAEWFAREKPLSLAYAIDKKWHTERATSNNAVGSLESDVLYGFERAVPFYWSDHMCDALEGLAQGMPPWTLTHDQLQANNGFVLFQRPLQLPRYSGKHSDLVSILWSSNTASSGIKLAFFAQTERRPNGGFLTIADWLWNETTEEMLDRMGLVYDAALQEPIGLYGDALTEHVAKRQWHERVEMAVRYFASAMVFMNQKIVVTSHRTAERHVRKRLQAKYPAEPPMVRIVELRSRRYERKEPQGDPVEIERTHRWWVRRHWRQQVYGDGSRRPIIIEPHVKGPEDKPLVAPPRDLFVIRR